MSPNRNHNVARLRIERLEARSLLAVDFVGPLPLSVVLQNGGAGTFYGPLPPSTAQAAALANTPPNTPIITEPLFEGIEVSPDDVHMEAPVYFDADGDAHASSDWEIWTVAPAQRVWVTSAITGVERVHTHLGDGIFENSHAGRTSLLYDTDYVMRVRFRDERGAVSDWASRGFRTGSPTAVFPLEMHDVVDWPSPTWLNSSTDAVPLPVGSQVFLEGAGGGQLVRFDGTGGGHAITDFAALAEHENVRLRFVAGATGLNLPESVLTVTEGDATRTIYVPALTAAAGQQVVLWVAGDGSTYHGAVGQTEPDFSSLARASALPFVALQPGYVIEPFATGFELPVNIAMVPNPGPNASDPFMYVTELYGTIKLVTRGGAVSTYASDLLNFDPTGLFPGSGEQGVTGILVDPATGDLFVTLLYSSNPSNEQAPHYPKIVRFHSNDGGRTAATMTTVLDMPGETQGQSHQISNLTFGPDGKLYVHVGDGFDSSTGQNLNSFRGKILRVNLNGTAPSDNPFYSAADGITARDYVFAYGFRNPFGGAWRPADGQHYEVENGPTVDRLAKIVAGRNYLFDGTNESMYNYAAYNWSPPHAPTNIVFVDPTVFGGSGFPQSKQGSAFVAESGPTWGTGPQAQGKRIVEFQLDANGNALSGPDTLVEYNGSGKASVSALAAGPDGLYFSDLYKDLGYTWPTDRGANVYRVRYVGVTDFEADVTAGAPALVVRFADKSDRPGITSRLWNFGDGATSAEPNPTHVYAAPGNYSVTLQVTSAAGTSTTTKQNYISVASAASGLLGEYFNNADLTDKALARVDAQVNFVWNQGSPAATVDADTFSARWSGYITAPTTGTVFFYTRSDDRVRLWINGQLLINNWTDHVITENNASIALVAGQKCTIKMEYAEKFEHAEAQLFWSAVGVPRQLVPASALTPADQGPVALSVGLSRAGGAGEYAVPGGSGAQLRRVPVAGPSELHVVLSGSVTIAQSNLTLTSAAHGTIATTGFSTQPGPVAGTTEAIWTFNPLVAADTYTITLADAVVDPAGFKLDGEWTNPAELATTSSSRFPSGDGRPGGNFSFRFVILPGDATGDNRVTGADYTIWAANFGVPGAARTFAQGDFTGDGFVTGADYTIWAANFQTITSAGLPLTTTTSAVATAAATPKSTSVAPIAKSVTFNGEDRPRDDDFTASRLARRLRTR